MLLFNMQCDVIVLLCESNYCSMLIVVGEDMFMEVAVCAMTELWDVMLARTYFPDTKCQAEGTFSAIDQCHRERERSIIAASKQGHEVWRTEYWIFLGVATLACRRSQVQSILLIRLFDGFSVSSTAYHLQ